MPSNRVIPFSSCLQSFPVSGLFPMSQFFASGGQSIGVSASASVLPMNIQDWFPLGLTGLINLQDGGVEDVHSSPVRTPNLKLIAEKPSKENVGYHQKEIPHVQGQRRSPSKMVGGVQSHLESNPIPARESQKAQTKPCVHQKTPQRLSQTCFWVFECFLQRYGSAVAWCRGRGSGCSWPGCCISPLGGGRH